MLTETHALERLDPRAELVSLPVVVSMGGSSRVFDTSVGLRRSTTTSSSVAGSVGDNEPARTIARASRTASSLSSFSAASARSLWSLRPDCVPFNKRPYSLLKYFKRPIGRRNSSSRVQICEFGSADEGVDGGGKFVEKFASTPGRRVLLRTGSHASKPVQYRSQYVVYGPSSSLICRME